MSQKSCASLGAKSARLDGNVTWWRLKEPSAQSVQSGRPRLRNESPIASLIMESSLWSETRSKLGRWSSTVLDQFYCTPPGHGPASIRADASLHEARLEAQRRRRARMSTAQVSVAFETDDHFTTKRFTSAKLFNVDSSHPTHSSV